MVSLNSLFDLKNKVALVTGASSGLGRRAAIVLSAAGAKVIGVARRRDALEELRKEIGNSFSFVVGDVAQRDKIKNLLSAASKEFGMPDILVHAAGLNPRQTANEVTSEGWDKTLEINLSAPFFLIAGCNLCDEREGLGSNSKFCFVAIYQSISRRFGIWSVEGWYCPVN